MYGLIKVPSGLLVLCFLCIFNFNRFATCEEFIVERESGKDFEYFNYTLTSSLFVHFKHCPSEKEAVLVDVFTGLFSTCENLTLWEGNVCLNEVCIQRNFTCCEDPNNDLVLEKEYGLATLGGEISVCKSKEEGWSNNLIVSKVTEESLPDLNIVPRISITIDSDTIHSELEAEFSVQIDSGISSVSSLMFNSLKEAFDSFCLANVQFCQGRRIVYTEYLTGSFACYSPPLAKTGETNIYDISIRKWLENNFPVLKLAFFDENDNISSTICISPWSYFVPVSPQIYCVGIKQAKSFPFVLGINLIEGNSIRFSGSKNVLLFPITSNDNCFVSDYCIPENSSQVNVDENEIHESPSSQDTTSPTINKKSRKVTHSPSFEEPDEQVQTHSPISRINQPTQFPSTAFSDSPTSTTESSTASSPEDTSENKANEFSLDSITLSPLAWLGIGSGITLFLLVCVFCTYYCCCGSSKRDVKNRQYQFSRVPTTENSDVELTNISTLPNRQTASSPQNTIGLKLSLNKIIGFAASPFEASPTISGGAVAFERAWNQGLVVDVWGATLRSAPVGDSISSYCTQMRLLRVASGTISGVEKMYWMAKLRSNPEVMGMIEISIDLTTKRLSAVFKTTRTTIRENQTDLQTLFDAFKRIIEEILC